MLRLVCSFLLVLSLAVGARPAAAEPASSRRMMTAEEQAHWPAIGRLNVTGLGFCTATLIGPDLVLTAAHCLVDRRKGALVDPARVHFLAGFRKGLYAAHGKAAEIALMPGYVRSKAHLGRDLALIRLTEPLPAGVAPIRAGAALRPAQGLDTLSYGLDRAQIPSWERDCRVRRQSGTVITTSCDGVPGTSGAPIVQLRDGHPQVVAVISALLPVKGSRVPRGAVMAVNAGAGQLEILYRQLQGTKVVALEQEPRPRPRDGS